MIIEDERPEELTEDTNDGGEVLREEYRWRNPLVLLEFLKIHKEIEDKQAHERLREDLIEHLWSIHSST